MSGFPIVDLVIGMIFIYFLLGIICSSAVEIVMTLLKVRSEVLEKWLLTILNKPVTLSNGKTIALGQAIMDHCSVTALSGSGKAPSYIDAKNFASALLEKISFDPNNPASIPSNIDQFITAIQSSPSLPEDLRRVLLSYAHEAKDTVATLTEKVEGEIELFRKKIENWYDSSMDRVTGFLKKKYARPFTFWIGAIIVFALNADSIAIAKYLYSNPEARIRLAEKAIAATQNDSIIRKVNNIHLSPADTTQAIKTYQAAADSLTKEWDDVKKAKAVLADIAPIGWNGVTFGDKAPGWFLSKLVGLIASVLATMMGAPFWFDMLNKISNLRSAGTKPPSTTSAKNQ